MYAYIMLVIYEKCSVFQKNGRAVKYNNKGRLLNRPVAVE